jgi:hypothetical protein
MAEVEARKAAVSRVPLEVNFRGRPSNFVALHCGVIRITARHSLWRYLSIYAEIDLRNQTSICRVASNGGQNGRLFHHHPDLLDRALALGLSAEYRA